MVITTSKFVIGAPPVPPSEKAAMERVVFTMRVAREHIPEYIEKHRTTWPSLLHELRRTGWSNYSLFIRDDGYLAGYWESVDAERSMAEMSATEVSPRWSVEMDRLVVPGSGMSYPTLTRTLGPTGSAGATRYLVVLEAGHPFSPSPSDWTRYAEFSTAEGERLIYGELHDPAAAPPTPFREVFNLDALLEGASVVE